VRQVEQRRVELAVEPAAESSKGPGRRPRRPIPPPANELVLKDRWEDRLQGGALLLGVATFGYQVDRGLPTEVRQSQRGTGAGRRCEANPETGVSDAR